MDNWTILFRYKVISLEIDMGLSYTEYCVLHCRAVVKYDPDMHDCNISNVSLWITDEQHMHISCSNQIKSK